MMFCRIWFMALICTKTVTRKINIGTCSRVESVFSDTGVVNQTTYFCCRHYEEINGECHACKEGFISDGTKCLPCDYGRFGARCIYTCQCSNFERCDNVKGCVMNKDNPITTFIGITGYTNEPGVMTERESSYGAFNPKELIRYCLVIVSVLFIVALCFVVNKYRFKSKRRRLNRHPNPRMNKSEDESISKADETNFVEMQEGIYHLIDESKMVDLISRSQESNTYLDVERSSSESESQVIHTEEISEYLHPYNTLIEDRKNDAHVYDDRRLNVKITGTSSKTSIRSFEEGYTHTPMDKPLHLAWNLEKQKNVLTAIIHTENDSSSDSDKV